MEDVVNASHQSILFLPPITTREETKNNPHNIIKYLEIMCDESWEAMLMAKNKMDELWAKVASTEAGDDYDNNMRKLIISVRNFDEAVLVFDTDKNLYDKLVTKYPENVE